MNYYINDLNRLYNYGLGLPTCFPQALPVHNPTVLILVVIASCRSLHCHLKCYLCDQCFFHLTTNQEGLTYLPTSCIMHYGPHRYEDTEIPVALLLVLLAVVFQTGFLDTYTDL